MIPLWVAQRVSGVITCDLAAEKGTLPVDSGSVVTTPPTVGTNQHTPAKMAKAYGLDTLYGMGFKGQGVKLGVTIGALFKFKDLQSFWQSFGIFRNNPTVVQTMEPYVSRYIEGTLDVEWSGALAPQADLIVYAGPDARNTSMVYTFNEAIGQGQVSVITDSFAHREDSEPAPVRMQYNDSALEAAALGITVMAASGDSAGADTPGVSPWVTSVGGTRLTWNTAQTAVSGEVAWGSSGCGDSLTFVMPDWQVPYVTNLEIPGKRATADLALNASPSSPFFMYYLSQWYGNYGGTSFASPSFGGIMAVVNNYRIANNLPQVGWLNGFLYSNAAVKQTFKDITSGGPTGKTAKVGWDYPTGWGAPNALGLALNIP
jgi:kumamolisin